MKYYLWSFDRHRPSLLPLRLSRSGAATVGNRFGLFQNWDGLVLEIERGQAIRWVSSILRSETQ